MMCEGMTGHCQKAENERPSKLLTDFEASKKRHDFDGSTCSSVKTMSDFVARATVIVLTGECSFPKIRLTVCRNGWPGVSSLNSFPGQIRVRCGRHIMCLRTLLSRKMFESMRQPHHVACTVVDKMLLI